MSFATFLRRYHSTPPEKMDGYSAADFADMSVEERAQARAMLTERGLTGDTIDIDGLRYVGDEQTVAALSAAEDSAAEFGPVFDIVRLETLFVLTGDPHHLARLLAWVDGPDERARSFAAETLTRHRLPADFADPIVARLTDGRHEDVVRQLVEGWIATRGEPTGSNLAEFQRWLPLVRAILEAAPASRAALLAEQG